MFKIEFAVHGNPDRGQGYWTENHTIVAPTMKELREEVLKFQGDNDIGGGNWGEATLYRDDTFVGYWMVVGYFSYNLRVWEKPYWESGASEVNI
jgi:hypothetical protein